MTNEEILKKAIEKVRKNGFERMLIDIDLSTEYPLIIFSHDFAKAFWGQTPFWFRHKATERDGLPAWQYHLQEMVIEEQPLKYLEKFL